MTSSKEDHLTEFFAAALELSRSARDRYFKAAISEYAERHGWGKCGISKVETQPAFDDTTCRPDLMLTLTNGKRIVCEHKLDSVETLGPECDDRGQLERYLELPIDGLIYVRASWNPPNKKVLRHPKYICPPTRQHFLWRDFCHIFDDSDDRFLGWIREGFEYLGFTPPHPSIGELSGPDGTQVEKNCRNFAKLWERTKTQASKLGWDVATGSIVQLYFSGNSRALASDVFIQPKGEILQLRFTPKKGKQATCQKRIEEASSAWTIKSEVIPTVARRQEGKVKVFDVMASLSDILGRERANPDVLEERLCNAVQHFLVPIQTR